VSGPAGADLDNPLPNPPPVPSDLPPPRLASPRGALRRSLILWGWGQIAAGGRRGWLGPPLQVGALAGLLAFGPAAARGTNAPLVFLAGALVLGLWVAIPFHAHRVASRRRAALDLPSGQTGGLDLLWLAPVAVVLSTAFWTGTGRLGDPGVVLADYVGDWRAGRVADAAGRFVATPGEGAALADAWGRQLANLRNDLVRLSAVSGPGSGIDPEQPLETVRWSLQPAEDPGTVLVDIEVVRRETVRSQVFGWLPSTSQRLVTLERLGTAELRLIDLPGTLGGQGWRIVRVEVGGVELGGSP
jgi:hypothetical protein